MESKKGKENFQEKHLILQISLVIQQHKRIIVERKERKENFQKKHLIGQISLLFLFLKTF